WKNGPTTRLKRQKQPLAQYIAWLAEAIASLPGVSFGELCQRMRRLYYSDFTDPTLFGTGVGGKFDSIITEVQKNGQPPLTAGPQLSLAALNGLYSCDFVITPNGSEVDLSHIFVALDIIQHGTGSLANNLAVDGLDWIGTVTWLGDLASWWMQ